MVNVLTTLSLSLQGLRRGFHVRGTRHISHDNFVGSGPYVFADCRSLLQSPSDGRELVQGCLQVLGDFAG